MTEVRAISEELSARLTRLEAVQMDHLRRCMFLLLYFTVAFACLAWERLNRFSLSLGVLPAATLILICLWVYTVARDARRLATLRKLSLLATCMESDELMTEGSNSGEQPTT
jgi:hypothetical protein